MGNIAGMKLELDFDEAIAPCSVGPVAAKSLDEGTPPAIVQSKPVPAQAMQLRKFRRSIPSFTIAFSLVDSSVSADSACGSAGTMPLVSFMKILHVCEPAASAFIPSTRE